MSISVLLYNGLICYEDCETHVTVRTGDNDRRFAVVVAHAFALPYPGCADEHCLAPNWVHIPAIPDMTVVLE